MITIYLIRHSVRLGKDLIEEYNTTQENIIKEEKIILSSLGEERAKILSEKDELNNIDKVYCSNCVRTIQTAKYLMEKQKLKCTIDERFDERRTGNLNKDKVPNWFELYFLDENFKAEGGESQLDVRKRMNEAINEILDNNKDKRIAIFTHGFVIVFYCLQYCNIDEVSNNKVIFNYKGKNILDRPINAPEVIKLTFNNKELIDMDLIEFDDLDFNLGV